MENTDLPICYNYPIQGQLHDSDIDLSMLNYKHKNTDFQELLFNKYPNYTLIYTDASKQYHQLEKSYRTGAAFFNFSTEQKGCYRLSGDSSVIEAYAIFKALIHAWLNQHKLCIIFTDAKAVLDILSTQKFFYKEFSIILDIYQKLHLLKTQGFDIRLVWVPEHMGISSMTTADSLAKIACLNGRVVNQPISFINYLDLVTNEALLTDHNNLHKWQDTSGFQKYAK